MAREHIPESFDWDLLNSEERSLWKDHLRACNSCRTQAIRRSPEALLFELGEELLPDAFWLGFWDSLEKRLPERSDNRAYRYARWVAVLVVALLLSIQAQNINITTPQTALIQQPKPAPVELPEYRTFPVIEDIKNPNATYTIFESNSEDKIILLIDPDLEL